MRPYSEYDLVSYNHHSEANDPNATCFIDLASSVIPVWAVNVQPFEYPEDEEPSGYSVEIFLGDEE